LNPELRVTFIIEYEIITSHYTGSSSKRCSKHREPSLQYSWKDKGKSKLETDKRSFEVISVSFSKSLFLFLFSQEEKDKNVWAIQATITAEPFTTKSRLRNAVVRLLCPSY